MGAKLSVGQIFKSTLTFHLDYPTVESGLSAQETLDDPQAATLKKKNCC
jgi:hypothetical protein